MEKFKRKLFFWFLVLVFFIVTPAIILQARGYAFDWKRGVFVYSGTISFKSNPQNITVALNDIVDNTASLNRINNSFNLSGLIPANYTFSVFAQDFSVWNKKIDVHSGVSSEFWNILLTKKNYVKTNYDQTKEINVFFTSPKNESIAFTTNSSQDLFLKILDLKDNLITNSFNLGDWQLLSQDKKENIEWSPDENYLSIPLEKNSPLELENDLPSTYYIIDLDQPQNNPLDLTTFFEKNNLHYVRWDPMEKGYLLFLENKTLFRANIQDSKDITQIANDVMAYDLSYNAIYFIQSPNNLVFKTSLNGKSEKTQITNNFPDTSNPAIKRMIVYDESRIAFLAQNKNLFIYNKGEYKKYFQTIGDNILQMQRVLVYPHQRVMNISVCFGKELLCKAFDNSNGGAYFVAHIG